ncbi:MAG: glycine betaine ABC transporter ATP-binding protein [Chloroflexi bacterium RBG_16_56_11]|nr:MAG: glycine betaine ABC transporter ATP-binding protein [Chloroflexi bacterium RBG_16_56_11]
MIRLENVTRLFDNVAAVDGFSLEVDQGEVCVLIGPSGCGKTTTLRLINRLVEPTSGTILVNGRDVSRTKAEVLRRSIGYAIQSVGLFPHMTVGANIGVVPGLLGWGKERISARVNELLELVGLEPRQYAPKYVSQLSGGEAQRVGVARALAADPPILLMDEPFGAVDPLTRQRLQVQFLRIQRKLKKTIILVTHDLDEAIRLADRIAVMQSGRLVQHDSPERILASPANKFVHDFVGVDRALKRLSRISVEEFIRPTPSVTTSATREELSAAIGGHRSVWVVDGDGRPIGWIDRASLRDPGQLNDITVRADPAEMYVTGSDTLHGALSRMLGLGFKSLPAVDDNGRLIGEITLGDIEKATARGENMDHV